MNIPQRFRHTRNDIAGGIRNWHLWSNLGWRDIRLRYRRTVIGPFWQSLSMAIFIATLGWLYSRFWNMPIHDFIPFLTAGMSAWILISALFTEATVMFLSGSAFIMLKYIPFSIFSFQLVYRNLLVLFHNILVVVIVNILFTVPFNLNILFFVPGLVVLSLNGVWISLLVGTFCTRFRDFGNLVASLLQVIFFITPIFWTPEQAGDRRVIFADSNPFYHLVELLRAPLLGQAPAALSWIVSIGMLLAGTTITAIVYGRYRSRIPYWL